MSYQSKDSRHELKNPPLPAQQNIHRVENNSQPPTLNSHTVDMESSSLEGLNFRHAPTPTPSLTPVLSEPTSLRSGILMNQLEEPATVSQPQTQLVSDPRNYEYETGLSSSFYAGVGLDSRTMPRENPWYSQPTFYRPQVPNSPSRGNTQAYAYYTPSTQQYYISHPSQPSYIISPLPSLEYYRSHMQSRPYEQQYAQIPYDDSQSYYLHPHLPQPAFSNQISFQHVHSPNPTSFGQPHLQTIQLLPVHAAPGHTYYPRLSVPPSGDLHGVPVHVMAIQPPQYQLVVDQPQKQPARFQQKPRDLENAMWVGNLPSNTNPEELKAFFEANEALPPNGISEFEGVFHIAKTHCAFVNYKSASAILRNIAAFHDKEFKGVRLVCRIKKSSTSPVVSAEVASDSNNSSGNSAESSRSPSSSTKATSSIRPKSSKSSRQQRGDESVDARYFILKSLTQDDLDISVKSGIWATQPHNESGLNRAFKSADSVYLIFSANKSGEFYGYARMTSPITPSHTDTSIEWTPVSLSPEDEDENENEDTKAPEGDKSVADVNRTDEVRKQEKQREKQWGNNFNVEWIKVRKLSFMQTRHIRNPWNSNREVKVSRDGTELETRTGERLLQEFHIEDPSSSQLAQEEPYLQSQQHGSIESGETDDHTIKYLNPQEGSVQFRLRGGNNIGDSLLQQKIPIILQQEDLERQVLEQQPQRPLLQRSPSSKEIDSDATEQPSPHVNPLALSGEKMAISSASPLPIDKLASLGDQSQYNPNVSNLINDRRTESSPAPRSLRNQDDDFTDRRRTL